MIKTNARLICFYLPQFHPIPENDRWWGKGFTEWTNVTAARPLFPGHYQPHVPADLGYYDLRDPKVRFAQTALAQRHGIEGFCYWHYWFEGKRLLEKPFDEVLATGEPDFPFCLAWANETWSRRWLGEESQILQKQTYSSEDDLNHIRWLIEAFKDPRYIRVHDRPLFLIYRPRHLPLPVRTTEIFRTECLKAGLSDPFLVGIDAHCPNADCRGLGFDTTLKFEPQLGFLPCTGAGRLNGMRRLRNRINGIDSSTLSVIQYQTADFFMGRPARTLNNVKSSLQFSNLLDPANLLRFWKQSLKPEFPVIPSVFVGWDNTPRRRKHGSVVINYSPDRFRERLNAGVEASLGKPFQERLVFINAWNEWAEGNHLEPDQKHGLAYLEAVKSVIES